VPSVDDANPLVAVELLLYKTEEAYGPLFAAITAEANADIWQASTKQPFDFFGGFSDDSAKLAVARQL
jgi:hypothetical protein